MVGIRKDYAHLENRLLDHWPESACCLVRYDSKESGSAEFVEDVVVFQSSVQELLDVLPAAEEPGDELQIDTPEAPDVVRRTDDQVCHPGVGFGWLVHPSARGSHFVRAVLLGSEFRCAEIADLQGAIRLVLILRTRKPEDVSRLDVAVPAKAHCRAFPLLAKGRDGVGWSRLVPVDLRQS